MYGVYKKTSYFLILHKLSLIRILRGLIRILEAMNFSGLSLCVMIILGLWGNAVVGFLERGENARNYITWDDMKVDPWRLLKSSVNSRNDRNRRRRIIVVDKSGGGDSVTVQGAVNMVPENNKHRVKIYIHPGNYSEKVHVPQTKPYISLIGSEKASSKTVITYKDSSSTIDRTTGSEMGTFNSASVFIESDYFCAFAITFENTFVPNTSKEDGNQAVALRIRAEHAMFYKVELLGTQDTLLDDKGTHYFLECFIQGRVDFIFGVARSLYQKCVIHSTARQAGAIAAHKRESPEENSGFSFMNCTINGSGKILLGRAWGNYSRTLYSYCQIDDIIDPAGWSDWDEPQRQKTAVFGEYRCSGRGADRRGRVPWSKSLSDEEARPFLGIDFIDEDQWLKL